MEKLAEIQTTDNVKIVLSKGEYRGSERVDIRQYYLKDDEYIATKKGINFNAEWIDQFLEMLEVLR
ncbi:MAG: transcriptional coactivator p15/PC4 family protein [Bacteroidales bacterium]|nr:transcriptional coactivator p15/PC4 family protein [Bacteroidales bacterium]